ncbi:16S rRNA (cytidine(1402)-2'-O)-methyltransferase [Gracilibacillus phocaeensis]|uniref:16S rRNA (cytidine(1402)-2'-O)-methyltransferase n=1 Tax=Gracilibacillus phocaeensis TaxID=2042304 RepID=UPI003306CE89
MSIKKGMVAMQIQKSYQNDSAGVLYIVPTPIGNLEDITFRALRVLEEADIVLAEDTRNTGKLLHHFDLKKRMISYHEHNKATRQDQILAMLAEGQTLVLVSDAGMPGISDPGYEVIQAAIDQDVAVIVLPGANAALPALVGSGLSTSSFYFYGFLPRKNKEREQAFELLASLDTTFILYESPHRITQTMEQLAERFGNRQASIARELSKKYEEYLRGNLPELAAWISDHPLKGECCIVIEGKQEQQEVEWWESLSVKAHVEQMMKERECTSKEAIKQVAKTRQLPKRDVYTAYHIQ